MFDKAMAMAVGMAMAMAVATAIAIAMAMAMAIAWPFCGLISGHLCGQFLLMASLKFR